MGMVLEAVASYLGSMIRELSEVELGMLPGVLGDMERMHVKLLDLMNFLVDANRRSTTDRSVQAWVIELQHTMYGATDIVDLCQLKAMERGSSAADGLGCFNPLLSCMMNLVYARDIGSRIKKLSERLDIIMERRAAFSFINLGAYEYHGGKVHVVARNTSGEFHLLGVVGEKIEADTKELVAQIRRTRNEVNDNIPVIAIVGVGGIGKTTLAKKVFNDEAIQGGFHKKIWLSVSKDFDEVELLRAVIVAAGGDLLHHGKTLAVLRPMLSAALTGKKLLLVMDDVWNHRAWENVLKIPFFNSVAQGSRVLITTRNEAVAQEMRAERPYHRVDKLGSEDAWSLMKRQVICSDTDELQIDMLKDIGLQIIARCGGLPLAVKVMAGLLCQREMQRRDWEKVLDDYSPGYEMPEEINYSMYLSYEEMSPCLKQCFLHYSLLPENVVFYENDIIGMWISEGFVHGNSQEPEEIGRGYYDELILMNLIETDARYTSQRVCNMNVVVRSFAQFICRDEALVTHNGEILDTSYLSSQKFCRLSLKSQGLESDMLIWSLLQEQTSLRTLVSIGQIKLKLGDSLVAFSTLRTLHIESANVAALVESLCQLKHLRYLSVAHTDVSSLPENINNIKLLQHINLDGCESLEKLPDSIVNLGKLRYLNLNDTSITAIPQGFSGLINLRKVYGFPAHMDGDWCSLEELGSLSELREIGLKGLDNIAATSCAKARLIDKVHLTYLKLGCTTRLGDDGLVKKGSFQDEENQRIEAVFDELYPPHCLHTLDIQGYFGLQLPSWLRTMDVTLFLINLVILTMEDLACCTQLPYSLCQLPHLKVLKIQRAPAITRVGPEFVGVHNHHTYMQTMFPRLHELVFIGMVEWEEWVWETQVNAQAMPVLEELQLDTCKLRSFPPGLAFHARALKRLVITAAPNLSSLDGFASVVELDVYFSPNLRSIANVPKLQMLTIVICPKFGTLIGVPAIQSLVLEAYDMKTLPRYLQDVRSLRLLQLDCSLKLLNSIAMGHSGPEWKKFSHVKHVKAYAHDGDNRRKWYVLYTKDPYNFETNISLPSSKLTAVGKGEDKLIGNDEEYILGTHSSSGSAVSEDDGELVGIDSPCKDLIKLLMHDKDKQLKIVSICGTGGLGKTTIANAVYTNIANEFSCKAFVDMPLDPDIKVIIGSIYAKVGYPCPNFEQCGVQQLIDQLRIFFQEQRYLIVFDDIWATSVWDQILPALGENNHGSRIIITTRKVSVAEHVGGLYHLPLLSYNDSKMLFFRRTLFGSEDHCPSQFRELSKKMLSRCGQLPLAIIVMTDLLPKGMVLEGWQKVCNSIEMHDGMKNIRRVLKRSYDDLPQHLQKCLLYLSIFPEGYKIRRDSLVQRWIAEDLICGEHGQNLQELGESYLYQLVDSSIIQPIEFDSFGRDVAYQLPVTTLDLIAALSIHENFVTILPSLQRTALPDKVQRLSLQDSNEQHDVLKATKTIGQVSSLSLFHGADLMQPLSKFQGLHVLDLEKCDSLKNEHLNGLGNLDKLKYLVLGSSHITEIPKKIWKLCHLQTLDLTATGVEELPSSTAKLTKLRRLLINRSTEVPDKIIGKLQALEELVEIDISKSPNTLQEISNLPELRVLSIALWSWDERHATLLSETLCKLTTKKLKHLSIFSCCSLDFKSDIQPLQQLEELEIEGSIFNKVPNWISKLTHLRALSIEVYSLKRDALRMLGKLTDLIFLSLVAKRAPGEKLLIGRDEFRSLKAFLLFNRAMTIKFEEGAMEKLQRLKLTLQASLTKTDDLCFGLEALSSLKHVQVDIISFSATDGAVKVAEAAIQSMIGNNPSKPTLEITRTVEKYMTNDKMREADREIKVEDEDQKALSEKKAEEYDPLQNPIDEVAVIMAGEGKKQGSYMLVDGYIEPPTPLSQIRASSSSGSSGVQPRGQPTRAMITDLQLEEERRQQLEEREAFERRVEEERRQRLEEREAFERRVEEERRQRLEEREAFERRVEEERRQRLEELEAFERRVEEERRQRLEEREAFKRRVEEERRQRPEERETFERRLEEERRLRLEGERQQAYMMEHLEAVYSRVIGIEVPPMTPPPSRAPNTTGSTRSNEPRGGPITESPVTPRSGASSSHQ